MFPWARKQTPRKPPTSSVASPTARERSAMNACAPGGRLRDHANVVVTRFLIYE